MIFDRQLRKEMKAYRKELEKEYEKKAFLINHNCDWGYLEELIKQANNNPGLKVTVRLQNGTVLELQTVNGQTSRNPIFGNADDA